MPGPKLTCLKCHEEFSDKTKLNYTCRCYTNHALCFPCSKDLRYTEARELFGFQHRLDVKEYHADDLEEWREKGRQKRREQEDFENKYIKPNYLVLHPDLSSVEKYLNVGNIFKEYFGEEHMSTRIPEKYEFTFVPEEVPNRWEKGKQNNRVLGRIHDIIHQIRTPIDTIFTMSENGNDIFRTKLKKDEPFELNLPIRYSNVYFSFQPETTFEYTYIDLWEGGWFDGDPLNKYINNILVNPDSNILISEGVLRPLDKHIKEY
uniref:Uncharacterized protein n=1 Tax=Marseillevirus LCMAC101 TaxID=2506602 RepID=A0A481YSS3_9VIRU|nr:MAG: hypothetical protein LCMAC101_07140 [Marseillevirus LCMAC101]